MNDTAAGVIQVEGIRKRFGRLLALDGVSFTVGQGEVLGFLGPNGAGKTTTLRIIAGFLAADGGRVVVDGHDVAADPLGAQRRLGYLPEQAPLHGEMRVGEYLAYRARLKGVARREIAARVDEVVAAVQISDVRLRRIGVLSRGYRQRVGLADALVGRPPILVLDEPTAGLDPGQIREVRDLVKALARERTVLFSSHILPEVEAVAGRVVIVARGKVVAEGTPGALRGAGTVRVGVPPDEVERAAAALGPDGEVVDAALGRLRARVAAEEVARRLVAAGCALRELAPEEKSLEEVFLELTR